MQLGEYSLLPEKHGVQRNQLPLPDSSKFLKKLPKKVPKKVHPKKSFPEKLHPQKNHQFFFLQNLLPKKLWGLVVADQVPGDPQNEWKTTDQSGDPPFF